MFDIQRFTSINEVRAGTTNFEVYDEGMRYLGIGSCDLPEFSLKAIDVNGAGIAGEMSIGVAGQFENAELTIHFREVSNRFMGLAAYKAHEITLRSAQHLYDAANGNIRQEPLKILVRGIISKIALGKLEQAAETESELTMNIDYIKIWVDGVMQMEFDRFNYIWKVRNKGTVKDYLSETRTALGLNATNAVTQTADALYTKK